MIQSEDRSAKRNSSKRSKSVMTSAMNENKNIDTHESRVEEARRNHHFGLKSTWAELHDMPHETEMLGGDTRIIKNTPLDETLWQSLCSVAALYDENPAMCIQRLLSKGIQDELRDHENLGMLIAKRICEEALDISHLHPNEREEAVKKIRQSKNPQAILPDCEMRD